MNWTGKDKAMDWRPLKAYMYVVSQGLGECADSHMYQRHDLTLAVFWQGVASGWI